jgi:hypothetical protein
MNDARKPFIMAVIHFPDPAQAQEKPHKSLLVKTLKYLMQFKNSLIKFLNLQHPL